MHFWRQLAAPALLAALFVAMPAHAVFGWFKKADPPCPIAKVVPPEQRPAVLIEQPPPRPPAPKPAPIVRVPIPPGEPHLDEGLLTAHDKTLPEIEGTAYKILDSVPGTPGFIKFNEALDAALRTKPDIAKALLQLSLNRLPYLQGETFNVVLSGGVADPWTPVIVAEAQARGLKVNVIKLPGGLAFARPEGRVEVPAFPADVAALLKAHPTVFFDDTYTNGGTAQAVRDAVVKHGGKIDGVFVVYEGGKGDPASLYKSGRMNKRAPSMGQFSVEPQSWKWKRGSKAIAVELEGTIFMPGTEEITVQGKRFLQVMSELDVPVQFLRRGAATHAPRSVTQAYPGLRLLPEEVGAGLAVGNWGREFRGAGGRNSLPKGFAQVLETGRIGHQRDEGVFSQDLLDKNYLLNRLSEMGVLEPVYARTAVPGTGTEPGKIIDLRPSKVP